jgi:malate dehydrogenase (oxaloacetate-decarboxylating)(NADP+)
MDPRLLKNIASAVSQAAIDSGVAVLNTVPTEYKL